MRTIHLYIGSNTFNFFLRGHHFKNHSFIHIIVIARRSSVSSMLSHPDIFIREIHAIKLSNRRLDELINTFVSVELCFMRKKMATKKIFVGNVTCCQVTGRLPPNYYYYIFKFIFSLRLYTFIKNILRILSTIKFMARKKITCAMLVIKS